MCFFIHGSLFTPLSYMYESHIVVLCWHLIHRLLPSLNSNPLAAGMCCMVWATSYWSPCFIGCFLFCVHGRTTCHPVLTTFPQPRHIPTRGYNIMQSSAPDDGHMVARNMLSYYRKRNKEYKKVTSSWFFLSTQYKKCHITTTTTQY